MRKILLGGLLAATMIMPASAAEVMWRSSKLIGLNVYNSQNEKLGDISEVLVDKSGKVDGVVIGVGGFLGMGQHDIKVDMSKLKFVDEPARTASTTTTGSAPKTDNRPATKTTALLPKASGIPTMLYSAERPRIRSRIRLSLSTTKTIFVGAWDGAAYIRPTPSLQI